MNNPYVIGLPTLPTLYKGYTYQIVGNPSVPTYHAQITKNMKTVPGPPSNSVVGANRKARAAIDKMAAIAE